MCARDIVSFMDGGAAVIRYANNVFDASYSHKRSSLSSGARRRIFHFRFLHPESCSCSLGKSMGQNH
jgi:hypothetical protein